MNKAIALISYLITHRWPPTCWNETNLCGRMNGLWSKFGEVDGVNVGACFHQKSSACQRNCCAYKQSFSFRISCCCVFLFSFLFFYVNTLMFNNESIFLDFLSILFFVLNVGASEIVFQILWPFFKFCYSARRLALADSLTSWWAGWLTGCLFNIFFFSKAAAGLCGQHLARLKKLV